VAGGLNTHAKPAATKAISSPLARQYAPVDQLLLERNSLRRIVRLTGVARNTMAKRVKKSAAAGSAAAPAAAEKGAEAARGGAGTRCAVDVCGP
jgi:hypothetical protein